MTQIMVAGFDRYFQIAPCFRDEDARADRSPGEFYQLDMEMSFVEQEEVFGVMEELFCGLFGEFSDWEITAPPFPRIPYAEALRRYGSDKPDLRFGLEIEDVSALFAGSPFRLFRKTVEEGGVVRALCVPDSLWLRYPAPGHADFPSPLPQEEYPPPAAALTLAAHPTGVISPPLFPGVITWRPS